MRAPTASIRPSTSTSTSTARPGSRRTARRLAVAVPAAALLIVAGCGNSDDEADTTTTTEKVTSSSEATTTSTTAGDAGAGGLEGAATTQVSVPRPTIDTAQLTDVTTGAHEGYDRVVFTFDGDLPGYDVGYLDGPVLEDGSGEPVAIQGDRAISVRVTPASGVRLTGESFEQTYTGPRQVAGPGGSVLEVVDAGDFEAQITWAIGVDGERPFKVSSLADPTRIVVDVAHD